MTVHETTRLCVADRTCRAWDPTAHKGRGAPAAATTHTLCDTCLTVAERAIRALPLDWRDLEQHLPRSMTVWGDSNSGTPGKGETPNPPIALGIEALQSAIWHACTAWETAIRHHCRLSDKPHRRPAPTRTVWIGTPDGHIHAGTQTLRIEHPTAASRPYRPGPVDVVRAIRILAPRLGVLADLPDTELPNYPLDTLVGALERRFDREPHERWDTVHRRGQTTYARVPGWLGVLDLAALHRRAVAMLGLTSPVRRLPGVCDRCQAQDMRQDWPRFKGDEQPVYCGQCGTSLPYERWRKHADLWADLVREVSA